MVPAQNRQNPRAGFPDGECNGQLEFEMAKQQGSEPKPQGSQQQGTQPAPVQQQAGSPVFKDWAAI